MVPCASQGQQPGWCSHLAMMAISLTLWPFWGTSPGLSLTVTRSRHLAAGDTCKEEEPTTLVSSPGTLGGVGGWLAGSSRHSQEAANGTQWVS
jgi:hypothetical protein